MSRPDVAAYIWPAYTGDEPRTRIFWPKGYGEWETVQDAVARFPGHLWPRKPLWGYVNEADPYVMQMEIDAAADHGVNVFIYDWYWFDRRPFLEQCLDNGFLKAKNRSRMKFYIMWANHNVTYGWDRRISMVDNQTHIWKGTVDFDEFKIIGRRWIDMYFTLPEYYTVDGKPVISIYDLNNFVNGLGGVSGAREAMEWLDGEAVKAGLPGVHFQLVKFGTVKLDLSGFDGGVREIQPSEIVRELPFESLTHYQYAHLGNMNRDYREIMKDVRKEWAEIDRDFEIPFWPHISMGWDNTPRYANHTDNVVTGNTPEVIKEALAEALARAEANNIPLVTLNSWNEWTETSYLEPDDLYGYGYLEAVRDVFGTK